MEEVYRNIYRVEIPLPNNPLRALNSYVIKGDTRNLIIDTGMNREECLTAMLKGLTELDLDLEKTDLYITHIHADHLGLVAKLAGVSAKVYFNRPDAEFFAATGKWEDQKNFALMCGFPETEVREAIEKHPGYRYQAPLKVPFTLLGEGDVLSIGEYRFQGIETPGHTPGHLCLYEPAHRLLFSGDHILGKITPNISSWSAEGEPLSEYLKSLDKIAALEVDLVLPGHRQILRNCRERILELKRHHAERAQEVLRILQEGPLNAYQAAARMTWEMSYKTWDEFPVSQKWFAAGEAIAHLKYLEAEGLVSKQLEMGNIIYSVVNQV